MFDGTWSNYPWFASGVVAVSDITRGLYLLRPRLGGTTDDAKVTLSLGGGGVPGEPGGSITPGTAGGTVTFSVGTGARIGDSVLIDDPAVGATCLETSNGRVLRCRLVGATPFAYSLQPRSAGSGPLPTELVVMVAGGGDETAPTDNRASLGVTATVSPGGGGGGGGGGAADLLLLFLCAGALRAARATRRAA